MKHPARRVAILAMAAVLSMACAHLSNASAEMSSGKQNKPLLSPAARANVHLTSGDIGIIYNMPSMRGRKIFGGLVPYGQVWRTGANSATTFKTTATLKIDEATVPTVPTGTYTLYTLPSEKTWKLIINKQNGQWGTEYDPSQDLVRVDMGKNTMSDPQEKMTIAFENTHGNRTELHIRWATTDVWVPVVAR